MNKKIATASKSVPIIVRQHLPSSQYDKQHQLKDKSFDFTDFD